MKKVSVDSYFESVQPLLECSDGAHRLVLCHYPMMTWNHVAHGSYLIYGHIPQQHRRHLLAAAGARWTRR